jgi:hypothetical protein
VAAAYEIQGRDASLFGSGPSGPATSGSLGLYIQGITTGGFSSVGGDTAGPSISNPTTNGSQALDSPLPTTAGPNLASLTSQATSNPLLLGLIAAVAVLAFMVLRK